MAIKVARGVVEEILRFPDQIKLQVQRADDPAAAAEALVNAAEEIEQLASDFLSDDGEPLTPNSVGGVVVVPSGPFLTGINAPMVPESELARIPDIVARHLAAAGVNNAVIALPPDTGPLDDIENTPRAVILRLFVAPLTSPDPAHVASNTGTGGQGMRERSYGAVVEDGRENATLAGRHRRNTLISARSVSSLLAGRLDVGTTLLRRGFHQQHQQHCRDTRRARHA